MKAKIKSAGFGPEVVVDSCGTSNYHIGDKPDVRTRENAKKNGLMLNHLGRQLTTADIEEFDYILAMDQSNFQNIMRLKNATQFSSKIKLMREFDPEPGDDVPDPYYGGEQGFQQVFDILDRSVDGFIAYLKSKGSL